MEGKDDALAKVLPLMGRIGGWCDFVATGIVDEQPDLLAPFLRFLNSGDAR